MSNRNCVGLLDRFVVCKKSILIDGNRSHSFGLFPSPQLLALLKRYDNGSDPSLRGAIVRHLTPLERADKYNPDGSFALNIKQIKAVSPVLLPGILISETDIDDVRAFPGALSYLPTDTDIIVPKSVPSGIPVQYQ